MIVLSYHAFLSYAPNFSIMFMGPSNEKGMNGF